MVFCQSRGCTDWQGSLEQIGGKGIMRQNKAGIPNLLLALLGPAKRHTEKHIRAHRKTRQMLEQRLGYRMPKPNNNAELFIT